MSSIQKRCAACGSEKIIPLATLTNDAPGQRHGNAYPSEPKVVINTNPRAGIFAQRSVLSRIHAWVCGECGYMPLFADDPHDLYAAYQEFLRATRG